MYVALQFILCLCLGLLPMAAITERRRMPGEAERKRQKRGMCEGGLNICVCSMPCEYAIVVILYCVMCMSVLAVPFSMVWSVTDDD